MKRRSATSSERQREELVFFVDRSLGRHAVADALRQTGARVEIHDDHFSQDIKDEVWIAEVACRGWIILSKDARIIKRPREIHEARIAEARLFILTSQGLPGPEMAAIFVKHLKRIENIIRSCRPPFWATVTKDQVTVQKL